MNGSRTSATCHHPEAVGAVLDYAPAAGAAAGQVSVSYLQGEEFAYAGGAAAYVSSCDNFGDSDVSDCEVSTLADGSTLRTYGIHLDLDGGTWEILVAERLVDGNVISVQSQAPRADDADGTVLAADAVLTTAQIGDIAAGLDFVS